MDEPKAFEVELHLHGGRVLKWRLAEASIREDAERLRNVEALQAMAEGDRDGDVRKGVRTAAYALLRDQLNVTTDNRCINVIPDDGENAIWIVPLPNVLGIRLADPMVGTGPRPFGFHEGQV